VLTELHHVTAVCSDAQETTRFYREELGMRLVKKTVNFDDPGSYHLYFGDEVGNPGTLITFFEWPGSPRGLLGWGVVESIGIALPGTKKAKRVEDPDGLRLELLPGDRVELAYASTYGQRSFYRDLIERKSPLRFAPPPSNPGLVSAGVTHHIAWRAKDEQEQIEKRRRLLELGLRPTEVYDRKYFKSIYFRMPDGILHEIATDPPGFTVDEPKAKLGESLALPDWLESQRPEIERQLQPV
jgi:glyoxalase family protein